MDLRDKKALTVRKDRKGDQDIRALQDNLVIQDQKEKEVYMVCVEGRVKLGTRGLQGNVDQKDIEMDDSGLFHMLNVHGGQYNEALQRFQLCTLCYGEDNYPPEELKVKCSRLCFQSQRPVFETEEMSADHVTIEATSFTPPWYSRGLLQTDRKYIPLRTRVFTEKKQNWSNWKFKAQF
ncbi:uncharacterized protein LOC129203447 isoform X4 [Grus americana]|uniref:uncharacterized protein LOC129203447 isoform X4 n=1 Tax=Grus americana TaxID=9117 RepID=UPI00240887F4|nr:uncharacterized protein LOC129203447 isoform X4 [Grus americana]